MTSFLYVIDIYSKNVWAVPLKDKKGIKSPKTFQKILDEFTHKPNKIWVDKGKSMKSWLQDDK